MAERIKNFNADIAEKRNARRRHEASEQDKEDELAAARKKHVELNEEHGQLTAEAKVKEAFFFFSTVLLNGLLKAQEERILDREALIREIAAQYNIRGFDVSPLEHNRVIDFTTKLGSLLAQQTTEVESIQVHPLCNYS